MLNFGQCIKGIIGNVEKYFQHDILNQFFLNIKSSMGCLAGIVGCALDFRSGHDLTIGVFETASGSVQIAQSLEPASDSVSPSLPIPHSCTLSLSLSKINMKKIKKINK